MVEAALVAPGPQHVATLTHQDPICSEMDRGVLRCLFSCGAILFIFSPPFNRGERTNKFALSVPSLLKSQELLGVSFGICFSWVIKLYRTIQMITSRQQPLTVSAACVTCTCRSIPRPQSNARKRLTGRRQLSRQGFCSRRCMNVGPLHQKSRN